jgi:hypothetical protein
MNRPSAQEAEMTTSVALKSLLGAAALTLPLIAFGESNLQTGTTALTATAHVDFSIVIPKILYLRVGTGSTYTGATPALSSVGTIDAITFSPAGGTVGNGTAVAGVGGDLTGGVETAAIVSNFGNVTLVATATGALSDGAGDSIPFTQITTASSQLTSTTPLPAPVLSNGASSTVTLTAPATKIITQDAKWTFSYANTVTAPSGTYGGTAALNGTVTYTATMP